MAINADYDRVDTFDIDPQTLVTIGNNLKDLGQAIADSIDRINNTWTELKLGWMGKTSEEAKDFIDRWNAVMNELFGTKEHPESGVLNAIVNGVLMTAGIFGQTEHTLVDFFTAFQHGLAGDGSDPSDTPPPSVTDVTTTAVTEQW
jgi:uncharacterized protein YukE